jgi:hypothetical protein
LFGIDGESAEQTEARSAAASGKRGKRGFGARNVVLFPNVGRCFTATVIPPAAGHLLLEYVVHLANLSAVCAEMMRFARLPVAAKNSAKLG